MQKITPFLWFNDKAEEAVDFYVSIFNNSAIDKTTRYDEDSAEVSNRAPGTVMTVKFHINEQEFIAFNGGPAFRFTPAISLFVSCEDEEIEALWSKLELGGKILMELGKYSFSEKFGWVVDKFGVSWQLNLAKQKQKITPFLMFVGEQQGRAEEAIDFYVTQFKNSKIVSILRYNEGENEPVGNIKHATFSLSGQEFMALDSSQEHSFSFSHAISFQIYCKNQEEVDRLWEGLSEGGRKEQSGWLTDRFGVAWQVLPVILETLINNPNVERSRRVIQAMLQMDKIDIARLKEAYEQKIKIF